MITLPEHFVPNTEGDLSQWPSSEEAGQVKYAEEGPSTSQPGYITMVGRTSADSEFQTVGYIKKLSEGTDLPEAQDSPPETEGNKTPSSAKKRGKYGPKTIKTVKINSEMLVINTWSVPLEENEIRVFISFLRQKFITSEPK